MNSPLSLNSELPRLPSLTPGLLLTPEPMVKARVSYRKRCMPSHLPAGRPDSKSLSIQQPDSSCSRDRLLSCRSPAPQPAEHATSLFSEALLLSKCFGSKAIDALGEAAGLQEASKLYHRTDSLELCVSFKGLQVQGFAFLQAAARCLAFVLAASSPAAHAGSDLSV